MAQLSKAEMAFAAKYPNYNLRKESTRHGKVTRYGVYAGDYVCSEALTAPEAFQEALKLEEAGFITPDPSERQTEGFELTIRHGVAARS